MELSCVCSFWDDLLMDKLCSCWKDLINGQVVFMLERPY